MAPLRRGLGFRYAESEATGTLEKQTRYRRARGQSNVMCDSNDFKPRIASVLLLGSFAKSARSEPTPRA